jgi:hypothetical protein
MIKLKCARNSLNVSSSVPPEIFVWAAFNACSYFLGLPSCHAMRVSS